MSKFKSGDEFYVKENGIRGKIFALFGIVEHNNPKLFYSVQWDHFSKPCSYMADSVDDAWEKVVVKLPGAIEFIPITIDFAGLEIAENELKRKAGCDHKRVNAGFHFNNFVCYHCGIAMP